MAKLVSQKTTYVFSKQDIRQMFADNLGVELWRVTVRYHIGQVGGDYWGRDSLTDVTSIEVEVNNGPKPETRDCRD